MDLFVKSIPQDSEEYKILKKTSSFKPQEKSFFLPIVKEVKRGNREGEIQRKHGEEGKSKEAGSGEEGQGG